MKLFYDTGATPGKGVIREFVLGSETVADKQLFDGATKVFATHFGIAESSIAYLFQYGYDQSMQDSIAGRAKRVRDEAEEAATKAGVAVDTAAVSAAVEADLQAALAKRHAAIVAGTIQSGSRGPRDPLRSLAVEVVQAQIAAKGLTVDKAQFKALVDEMLRDRRPALQKEADTRAKRLASILTA